MTDEQPWMSKDLLVRLRWWAFKFCGKGEHENLASDAMSEAGWRIEKLEAALTPFLKFPIGVINDDPPEMEVYQCHGWPRDQLAVVTVADFRRVRKALEGKDD